MAISDTMKRNPVFQEVFGLMEAKKVKAIKKWHNEKVAYMKTNYAPYVSRNMFDTYKTELEQYVQTLENKYAAYKTASTAGKETILTKLVTTERRGLANCIDLMNRERQNNIRTNPRATRSAAEPKKSGWWKHALGYGILGVALLTAWFSKGDKSQTQSGSSAGNGNPPPVQQSGNTFVAPSPTESLRDRLAQSQMMLAIAKNEAQMDKLECEKQQRRLNLRQNLAYTQGYEQGQVQGAIRDKAWTTEEVSRANRRVRKDQVGQAVDQSDAARRISDNNNSMRRNTSGTARQVRRDWYTW